MSEDIKGKESGTEAVAKATPAKKAAAPAPKVVEAKAAAPAPAPAVEAPAPAPAAVTKGQRIAQQFINRAKA